VQKIPLKGEDVLEKNKSGEGLSVFSPVLSIPNQIDVVYFETVAFQLLDHIEKGNLV
jgi:hypothetical protein